VSSEEHSSDGPRWVEVAGDSAGQIQQTTDNKQLMHDVLPMRFFCLTGDDMQSPFLGDAALAVDHEVLSRRAVRSVLAWMDEAAAPGVPHRVALKLLDDGRQASGSRVGGS